MDNGYAGYVRAGLDDERIYMSDNGCVHSWKRTPELARVELLYRVGGDTRERTIVMYSILEATYQNPTIEQLVRWQ